MAGGRPMLYESKEELERKIEEYFDKCAGHMLEDDEGKPVLNKWDEPVILGAKPPTMTGLALFLGFSGRQTLLNYHERQEFMDAITRAKSRIEAYAEARLYDKEGVNGAKFNLQNNFGWRDKQEVEAVNTNLNADLTERQAEEILKKHGIDI